MPVEKFRSIEEMNKASVDESEEPPFERFLRLCARYWAIAPNTILAVCSSSAQLKKHKKRARNTWAE